MYATPKIRTLNSFNEYFFLIFTILLAISFIELLLINLEIFPRVYLFFLFRIEKRIGSFVKHEPPTPGLGFLKLFLSYPKLAFVIISLISKL